jgi:large subunit ribosomal protein L30
LPKLDSLIMMAASGESDAPASNQPAAPAKPARPSGGADKRRLRLTQVRSSIGESPRHRGTLRALGLGKIGRTAEQDADSPVIAGMLRKVAHLVKVEDA